MSRKYKFHNKEGLYFVSFATVNWIDVFTRQVYFDILTESVNYCREAKGMEVYAYCFMPSHVHFIFRSSNNQPTELLRDFKKYTSKKIIEAIENNPQESKRELLLWLFERAGKKQGNVTKYQFWQHHNNPVESGFVTSPVDWKYSSARNFQDDHTILKIDETGFLA
jgi:putative transposase